MFKSYVFVQVNNYKKQIMVLEPNSVVNYVHSCGQPALIYKNAMIKLDDKEFQLVRHNRDYSGFCCFSELYLLTNRLNL